MVHRNLIPYGLSVPLAALAFASCSGPQTFNSSLPQTQASRTSKTTLISAASHQRAGSLLYAGDDAGHVFVFSYPRGALQNTLDVAANATCSDRTGDVFVTELVGSASQILEYAHGGSEPINTLSDPGYAMGCAVDPVSGNLAVANFASGSTIGSVLVYLNATGSPMTYSNSAFYTYSFCGYDSKGNLYVDGSGGGPSYRFQLQNCHRMETL